MKTLFFLEVFGNAVSSPFSEQSKEGHWWEIATGILAIPAALLGLALAYLTIRKTQLESKKIELELREKQALITLKIDSNSLESKQIAQNIFDPLIENNKANYFVLRFITIYLIFQFFGVFEQVFGFTIGSAFFVLQKKIDNAFILQISIFLLTQIPNFIKIIIVFLFCWPLYKDIAYHINFDFFRKKKKERASVEKSEP